MNINIADGVDIDAQLVMTGRGCVIGQSGSGKSYLVGVMAEELCRLGLPFCMIDTEGEYSRLKTAFQVIVVGGSDGDVGMPADLEALFRLSISEGFPVVFDVSDEVDKPAAVEAALYAIYGQEESMKKPYLVIVEEADKFAPQAAHSKLNMIEEISVRGRKRGIGILVATQRPASISKNVLAQCSYGFIGKLVIGNDIRAVSTLLGGAGNLEKLAMHATGEFTPFGIGHDMQFKVKARSTAHGGSTPSIQGEGAAGAKLSSIIMQLKALNAPSANQLQKKGGAGTVNIDVVSANISQDEAKMYAARAAKKRFVLFGKAVEEVDRITPKFMGVALLGIRIPTKRDGEYEERYLVLDGRLRSVSFNGRVSFIEGRAGQKTRLSKGDMEILSFVGTKRKTTSPAIQKSLGKDPLYVDNSLGRLSSAGLIRLKNDVATIVDNSRALIDSAPPLRAETQDKDSIISNEFNERVIRDYESTIFPGSVITSLKWIYLPVYEIRLRHGNKVRIFTIDAVYGGRLV